MLVMTKKLILLFSLTFFLFPATSFANIIIPDDGTFTDLTAMHASNPIYQAQPLGTGITGTLTGIDFTVTTSSTGSGDQNTYVGLRIYDNATHYNTAVSTGNFNANDSDPAYNRLQAMVSYTSGTYPITQNNLNYTFDPDKWYILVIGLSRLSGSPSGDFKLSSVNTEFFDSVVDVDYGPNQRAGGNAPKNISVSLKGINTPVSFSETEIVSITEPVSGQTYTTGATTDFQFDYYWHGEYPELDIVGVAITDISLGLQIPALELNIIKTGLSTFTDSKIFADGVYQWRPYMRSTATGQQIQGDSLYFTVGDNDSIINYVAPTATSTTDISLDCSQGNAITNSVCNISGYLFVPSPTATLGFQEVNENLKNKFPFAYAYDFKDNITLLYTTTQTGTSSLTLPFADYGNITLISTDMLNALPYIGLMRTLIAYALWLMFAIAMYHRTLRIFNSNPQ